MNKIEDRKYFDYADVLIKPKYSFLNSRNDVNLKRHYEIRDVEFDAVPIIISNMTSSGTFGMAHATEDCGLITCFHKHYEVRDFDNQYFNNFHFISSGISNKDFERLEYIFYNKDHSYNHYGIVIDVANGYMKQLFDFITRVRKRFPKHVIMAGNICTPDIILDYAAVGVDIIKVGIGNGLHCRTRDVTGIGIPQLTAVLDTVEEADKYGVMICADGGIDVPADFVKGLGAGADFIMAGSIFSGHRESGGKVVIKDDQIYKETYGMSSYSAMETYSGGIADYRTSEGRTTLIPFRGDVKNTVSEILGGIRSAMTYTNTKDIVDFSNNVTFAPVQETINRKHVSDTIGK